MKFNSATVAAGGKVTHKVSFGDGYGKPTTKAANVRWWYGLYYDKEEVTSTAARSCVALTQTGTLTVSRAIADYPVDTIVVGAYTTDGSNVEDVFVYDLVDRKTTTIIPGYKTIAGYAGDIVQGAVISNSVFNDFTITSSNPKVASYYRFYTDTVDKKIAWIELACNQRGTAVITVKANDGSGKYCTFTVKVY